MAMVMTDNRHYTAIADAIREKTGEIAGLTPAQMAEGVGAVYEAGKRSSAAEIDHWAEDGVVSGSFGSGGGIYSNDRITKVKSRAFEGAWGLSGVDLPNVTEIQDHAFSEAYPFSTANLPKAESIFQYAFLYTGLKEILLPKCYLVNEGAFQYAYELTRVELGSGADILASAFANTSLDTLILRETCWLLSTTAFASTPIAKGTGYIYVPAALLDSYQTATNWSSFSAQFRTIEDYPDICG